MMGYFYSTGTHTETHIAIVREPSRWLRGIDRICALMGEIVIHVHPLNSVNILVLTEIQEAS